MNGALWSDSRQAVEIVDANGLSSIFEFKKYDSCFGLRGKVTVILLSKMQQSYWIDSRRQD